MPFNKSIAVIAHTRYELGRHTPEEWNLLNENLQRIAASPYNIIAANNLYDQQYIKYFTGKLSCNTDCLRSPLHLLT